MPSRIPGPMRQDQKPDDYGSVARPSGGRRHPASGARPRPRGESERPPAPCGRSMARLSTAWPRPPRRSRPGEPCRRRLAALPQGARVLREGSRALERRKVVHDHDHDRVRVGNLAIDGVAGSSRQEEWCQWPSEPAHRRTSNLPTDTKTERWRHENWTAAVTWPT